MKDNLVEQTKESYESISYFSSSFVDTNPYRLEACGNLFGINPNPTKEAKILEIGCSFGGNLIPFALHNPKAKLLGIDLSENQIKKGNEIIKSIKGLDNVKLLQKDICELSADDISEYGKFDYIICHGVYSWVPDFVRAGILRVVREFMAPNGVAYISYNTYPGWKNKEICRDVMRFAGKDEPNLVKKLEKAKEALRFYKYAFEKNLEKTPELEALIPFQNLIKNIDEILVSNQDFYLIHEYLEPLNQPFYFNDFYLDCADFGLSYLCESDFSGLFEVNFTDEKMENFLNNQSRINQEQYFDFLKNKQFRRSIVVHSERYKEIANEKVSITEISKLNIIAKFDKKDDGYYSKKRKLDEDYNWLYETFNKMHPSSVSLRDVLQVVDKSLQLRAYLGFVEILKYCELTFTNEPLDKVSYEPNLTRLNEKVISFLQYFIKNDKYEINFADKFGASMRFKKLDFYTLSLFDGKNTLDEIANLTIKFMEKNNMVAKKDGKYITNKDELKKYTLKEVEKLKNYLTNRHFFEIIKG